MPPELINEFKKHNIPVFSPADLTEEDKEFVRELQLFQKSIQVAQELKDYEAVMDIITLFGKNIDKYLDSVKVNDPNPQIKYNREWLLNKLNTYMDSLGNWERLYK